MVQTIRILSLGLLVITITATFCACSGNKSVPTQQEDMDRYEEKEFKPRIDQVLNSSLPEAERKRAEFYKEQKEELMEDEGLIPPRPTPSNW